MSQKFWLTIMGLLLLFGGAGQARAQGSTEERKVEIGGHYTTFVVDDETDAAKGFGGRVTYNVTDNLAVEAEGNFFPEDDFFRDGDKTQGLFGVKAGKRFERVGIFGKARPGFMHFSEGDVRFTGGAGCVGASPIPRSCFEIASKTVFAMDVGAVLEIYPTSRLVIRLDGGDTILRAGAETVTLGNVTFEQPASTSHIFQGTVGVGFRF